MFGFVRKSLYDEAIKKLSESEYNLKKSTLTAKTLKEQITALHAENYRMEGRLYASQRSKQAPSSSFSPDELRSLLQLVHPDKHGGKESAVRLTQKINELRK